MQDKFDEFYRALLDSNTDRAKAVGWKNDLAQQIRFEQVWKVVTKSEFSINDLGCGLGEFLNFLRTKPVNFVYKGYDVMQDMVDGATALFGTSSQHTFMKIGNATEITSADYTVASGIFNIRFESTDQSWHAYILETLQAMNTKSIKGFSFNMLSTYSDLHMRRADLFYGDPLYYFDFCKKNFSKHVSLIHDYGQYDFTIIVRKEI